MTPFFKKIKSHIKRYEKIYHVLWKSIPYILSIIALYISIQGQRQARLVERLDLKPILELNTEFRYIKNSPPYVTIKNVGPVEALQMVIQLTSLRYSDLSKSIKMALTDSRWRWEIPELTPLKTCYIKLPNSLLYDGSIKIEKPLKYNVFKLSIKYRRNPDRKQFEECAFYFVNPEGEWTGENSTSINNDEYKEIKEAVFKKMSLDVPFLGNDRLHSIKH